MGNRRTIPSLYVYNIFASLQIVSFLAAVPLDLLDLMDADDLNPDCFIRALLGEALGQLDGLKKRMDALQMLACAIEEGAVDGRDWEKEGLGEGRERSKSKSGPSSGLASPGDKLLTDKHHSCKKRRKRDGDSDTS